MNAHTHLRTHDKKHVLFLCTGNLCRSQMAEGWARHLHGNILEVYSAGTAPNDVDPWAVKVMSEAGVDISGQTSNPVGGYTDIPFDLVITVCDSARESCPVFPGKGRTLNLPLTTPPAWLEKMPRRKML